MKHMVHVHLYCFFNLISNLQWTVKNRVCQNNQYHFICVKVLWYKNRDPHAGTGFFVISYTQEKCSIVLPVCEKQHHCIGWDCVKTGKIPQTHKANKRKTFGRFFTQE